MSHNIQKSSQAQTPSTAKIRELTVTEIKNVSGGKVRAAGRVVGKPVKGRAPVYYR